MPAFHEVRFPELISWGSEGGPGFNTSVIEFGTGKEQRNQEWTIGRAEWDVAAGVKTQDELDEVVEFFRARRGKAHSFRYKAWEDYKLVDALLQNSTDDTFVGDGTTTIFRAVRIYEQVSPPPASTSVNPEIKRVYKLRGGAGDPLSLLVEAVKLDGIVQGGGAYSINRNTGLVTFTSPPGIGVVPTITTEWDYPARFDIDKLRTRIDDFNSFSWSGVLVKEVNPLMEPT